MGGIDTMQLIYLVVLGTMVIGWFILQSRESLNRSLQHAAVWGMIFVGGAAAVGLWQDISRDARHPQMVLTGGDRIVVPKSRDSHYYLTLDINDTPIRFVVDTGATDLVLTQADARRAGVDPDSLKFHGTANTANGEVRTAFVTLDTVTLGAVTDTDVAAVVNAGEMRQSLLGMGYLQRWGRIEITGRRVDPHPVSRSQMLRGGCAGGPWLLPCRCRLRLRFPPFSPKRPDSSDQYCAAAPASFSSFHWSRARFSARSSSPSKSTQTRSSAATSCAVTSAPCTEMTQAGAFAAAAAVVSSTGCAASCGPPAMPCGRNPSSGPSHRARSNASSPAASVPRTATRQPWASDRSSSIRRVSTRGRRVR